MRPDPASHHLVATLKGVSVKDHGDISARLQRLFDTEAPVGSIERHLVRSPRLAQTVRRERGLRIPGAWDLFELTVRAILGQQVTVKGATTLTGRLVQRYGVRTDSGMLFPRPEAMAGEDLAPVGLPRARAAALRGVAAAFASPRPPDSVEALLALPGIGTWTAQYVAMRAFHDPDAFPASDLGLIHAAGRDVAAQAEAWRPWRAYAAMHLWMEQRQ